MSRKFLLNLAPVSFTDKKVAVELFDYRDEDQLLGLRKDHGDTHFIQRQKGNQIIAVPTVVGAPALGGSPGEVRLHDQLGLCAALLRHALVTHLHGLGREVLWFNPVEFIGQGTHDDMLGRVVESPLTCPDWLQVRPKYDLAARRVAFDKQAPFVGLALNVRARRIIRAPCSVLRAAGVDVIGHYVGQMRAFEDERLSPQLKLVGRVRSLDGSHLLLDDARSGIESVADGEAYLKPDGFDACVRAVFGARAGEVAQALAAQQARLRSGPEKLRRLNGVLRGLNEANLELLPGVPVRIEPFLAERSPGKTTVRFPAVASAPRAVFVFHPNNEHTHRWSDGGLEQFGPYDADVFTPTQPRVCVVCQRDKKGQVETFLNKLKDGISARGSGRAPFAQGFVRKYRLQDLKVEFFLTDNATPAAYARAVRQALTVQGQKGQGQRWWHLAMVQIEEAFHDLSGDANPYLVTKAEFLARDIPVQEFEIETASLRDYHLQYALNNMALAVYAKLGGVPWRVQANRAMAHELVFGLGSAVISESVLGSKERVVGVTTVFSGDGYYWLSNLSRSVPFEEYEETLLTSLRGTVAQVRADMNWQTGDTVRLVFHSFKPFKDVEAEAVKEVMKELGDFNVEYAFLHVIDDHPYLLFDEGQAGVQAGGEQRKGVYAPPRGLFTQLSPREVLITLTGPSDLKRPEDGLPFPVLLRLHRESNFDDMVYLTRQVFVFANHSWRSFFPSRMPVTILYSQLIAGLLGQLAHVTRWNPNVMLDQIGRTRWFL